MAPELLAFDGWIAGAAFASGDRFVVGRWPRSPFGSFADVMWARPGGERVLLASDERALAFILRHYTFEEHRATPVDVRVSPRRIHVSAAQVELDLDLEPPGALSRLLALRPRRLRTLRTWIAIEDRLARPLVAPLLGGGAGIHARGRTRGGSREWYAIHAFRLARARAAIGGVDLGATVPARACGFGFSEFPPMPAAVRVTSLIEA